MCSAADAFTITVSPDDGPPHFERTDDDLARLGLGDWQVRRLLKRAETLDRGVWILYSCSTAGTAFGRAANCITPHVPPHFHVIDGDINASFTIEDCRHLKGEIDSGQRRMVEWWYQ